MSKKKLPEGESMDNVTNLADALFREAQAEKRDGDDGRPLIRLVRGELPRILDESDAALGQSDLTIFSQNTRLVRVIAIEGNETGGGIHRPAGAVVIQSVTSAHLLDRFALAASWQKFDSRNKEWLASDVPRTVADSFIARAGSWKHLPALAGVVEAPCLRADGSVLDVPGHDKASGIYFAGKLPDGYRSPAARPTREQAIEALDLLRELIWDFPFIDEADRCAAVAGILTALMRRTLSSAPMLAITAPTAGTGKTKLAYVIAILTTGRPASVVSLGEKSEEFEKKLTGALLAGDAIILLDNIERPLFGDLLCQVLSQPSANLRRLGNSELLNTPTNSAFIATGNNLDIRGDLKRRILLTRIDAKLERPERRKFARDVLEDAARRRGELVAAALTIVRAYIAAGSPDVDAFPFGGFEAWDAWCRRPLLWLGCPDPLRSSEEVREEDPDIAMQRALFEAWRDAFGTSKAMQVSEIVSAGSASAGGSPVNPQLHEALLSACGEKITGKRLGNWLRRHRGRIVDGLKVERAGQDAATKYALWRLMEARP